MAKARMLHKIISISLQVNKLSLPARLLFTWMIAHADDDGRMHGEPEYIKATVVPMTKWSFKKIRAYLEEISKAGLIFWWSNPQNNEWFVEFINWKKYQQIKSDRYKPSDLPSFNKESGNTMEPNGIQIGTESAPQANISEYNQGKFNKGEYIADKNFKPSNEGELAAWEAHKELEPNRPWALKLTYLRALEKGLPPAKFYQYMSEIKQDPTIKDKGKVFNAKVTEWLEKQKGLAIQK